MYTTCVGLQQARLACAFDYKWKVESPFRKVTMYPKLKFLQLTGLTLSCLKLSPDFVITKYVICVGNNDKASMRIRLQVESPVIWNKQTNPKFKLSSANWTDSKLPKVETWSSRNMYYALARGRQARLACAFDCKWKVESLNVENATYLRYAHRWNSWRAYLLYDALTMNSAAVCSGQNGLGCLGLFILCT